MSHTIVFFGSGPVAAESLRLLLNDFEVEAVITKPTTEREMRLVAGKVPVYTASNKLQLNELIIDSKKISSQLGVLIDFGIIVSKQIIDCFPLGIVNSHFSILPEWRGADPINFAILSGQKMTGVSLMMLVEAMDEGPLIGYGEQPLNGTENSTELTKELVSLSHTLLVHDLPRIFSGQSEDGAPQSITKRKVSYSRKLIKEDGILDFHKPAKVLEREIRAFIEWPKSRTQIANKDIVILKASVDELQNGEIGKVFITLDKRIGICTTNGALIIEELKPANKNAMSAGAFLAGYKSLL